METPSTYVIRVYRQDPSGMYGTVELALSGEQLPFHSPDELWRALKNLPSCRIEVTHPSKEGEA